jgi:hypothetical protein
VPFSENGRRTFGIVVGALLRAGIKAIPFIGSALDQATFGVKESLEKAEAKDVLNRIVMMLQEYQSTRDIKNADAAGIASDLAKLAGAAYVIERLEAASPSTQRTLAAAVMALEERVGAAVDTVMDVRDIAKAIEKTTQRVRQSQLSADARYQHIVDSLDRISETLSSTATSPGRTLRQVYDDLARLDSAILVRTARSIKHSLILLHGGRGPAGFATVDFDVMHDYAYSPYLRRAEDSFSVAALCTSNRPLFMLPGTMIELDSFLRGAYNVALNQASFQKLDLERKLAGLMRANDDDPVSPLLVGRLADIAFSNNSPLQRLKRLVDEKKVVPWESPLPSGGELRPRIDAALDALTAERPSSHRANSIDALNLAVIACLNDHEPDANRILHVTRSIAAERAARQLQAWPTAELRHSLPLTCDPCTWSFLVYAERHQRYSTTLDNACEVLEFVKGNLDGWRKALRNIFDCNVMDIREELQVVKGALAAFSDAVDPWHRYVLDVEGRDLLPEHYFQGSTQWELELRVARDRLISLIVDLQAFFEPFVRAAHPFIDLSRNLAGQTGPGLLSPEQH